MFRIQVFEPLIVFCIFETFTLRRHFAINKHEFTYLSCLPLQCEGTTPIENRHFPKTKFIAKTGSVSRLNARPRWVVMTSTAGVCLVLPWAAVMLSVLQAYIIPPIFVVPVELFSFGETNFIITITLPRQWELIVMWTGMDSDTQQSLWLKQRTTR